MSSTGHRDFRSSTTCQTVSGPDPDPKAAGDYSVFQEGEAF
jgi:hypothetical protein